MKKAFALVGIFFQFVVAFALQIGEPNFRNLGINEGLPSSEVYRIIQDKQGFIWFSTDAGVCRFNGRSFKCYTTADGLPDNTVFDLLEDSQGRIWMNCFNGTICYFEKGKFIIPKGALLLRDRLKKRSTIVTSIQFDKEQTLWIGTSNFPCVLKKNDNYASLSNVSSQNDSANAIIYELNNGKTIESINFFSPQKLKNPEQVNRFYFQIKPYNRPAILNFVSVPTPYNPKLFSLRTKDNRLLFSYKSKLFEYREGSILEHSFPKTIISIQEDYEGNIWVGLARGGVYFFENGILARKPQVFLKDFSISHLLFDNENGIWASTFEKGIFYCPFLNYFIFPNQAELSSSIAGITAFGKKIYVATSSNFIFSIDKASQIKELPFFKEANLQTKMNFFPLKGQLMVSGSLLASFDTSTQKFTYLKGGQNQFYFAGAVGQGSKGRIAFVAQGMFYEIENEKTIFKISLPERATTLFLSADSQQYVGTLNGLFVRNGNKFELVKNSVLAKERINHITGDNKHLFVCTKNKGIFIAEQGNWTMLNKTNGLASDICNFALIDTHDTIWVATNKGISFFNSKHPSVIKTLNISNGLPTNEISSLARNENQLFVATREGLCIIDLNKKYFNTIPPEIYISKVIENTKNRPIENNSILEYKQNTLRFFVECPSYKKQFSPRYRYTLKGFSDSVYYSENEILDFQNLEPGDYTLEVRGINNNEVYSKSAAYFKFKIKRPFWTSVWFIVLMIALMAAIVYLFIIWRISRIRRQEELKSELNAMLNESRMAALQAQMNPHFIFNAINSIQSFILNNETQLAYDYLAKFAKLVRLVLSNSKQSLLLLKTEIETLELYVEMEKIRFKNSFNFEVKFKDAEEDYSEVEIPVMLIQPFIENSIWHGIMPIKDKVNGKIELRFFLHETSLEVEIEDNGIGYNQAQALRTDKNHKSLGIQLVQERLALLDSKQKNKARFQIIDLKETSKNKTGTLVKITIPLVT